MFNVLIFGGCVLVVFDYVCCFVYQGWMVCIVDSILCQISGVFKVVLVSFCIVLLCYVFVQFVVDFVCIVYECFIDLFVLICEEVFFVLCYWYYLLIYVWVLVEDFDKLCVVYSKWIFFELVQDCGVDVLVFVWVCMLDEVCVWVVGCVVVFKLEFLCFGVYVCLYCDGIFDDVLLLVDFGVWVVQMLVVGQEFCLYSVVDCGWFVVYVLYCFDWCMLISVSFYFVFVCIDVVCNFVVNFVCKFDFMGQFLFDWIQQVDGCVSLFECNLCVISGCYLFGLDDVLFVVLVGMFDGCIELLLGVLCMVVVVMVLVGLFDVLCYGMLC